MPVKECKTKEEFDTCLKEAGDRLVVVDFYATWCGPCKMISPRVEAFSNEYTNVVFLKVDVDQNEDTAADCEISAMPTFLFFKNGAKKETVVGADERKLKAKIEELK